MKPTRIVLDDFLTYRDADFALPAEGLVMLTGSNGAGKSSILESIAWTLWGETIRGSDPVPAGRTSILFGDGIGVRRQRTGRKLTDLVLVDRELDISGQTPTETQAKINQRFGDWRRFCATRVFSRELLSRFGNATNKERQTLLEGILGLEQFSRAEKIARLVLAECRRLEQKVASELGAAEAALRSSNEAGEVKPDPKLLSAVQAKIVALERAKAVSDASWAKYSAALQRLDFQVRKAQAVTHSKRAELHGLAGQINQLASKAAGATSLDDCPVCLRAVGAGDKRAIAKHYGDEAMPLKERVARLTRDLEILSADTADQEQSMETAQAEAATITGESMALANEIVKLQRQVAVLEAQASQYQKFESMIARDTLAVKSAADAVANAVVKTAIASAAVEALGARGARVNLFDSALNRLQKETNSVLARLGLDLAVELSAKKTQVSGKEVDEVSLKVQGAGGGGYLGTSGGERTRIDVAMLLALARMAGEDGILMFDEIFDPLDDDGLERVAELLGEMATDRQVLVTSHNARLVSLIPQSCVWEATKVGGVSRIST